MTDSTTTLKRINEDSYAVLVDGERIGEVTKGWSTPGGQGWIYSNNVVGEGRISTMLTVATRKQAVATLTRRVSNGPTDDANAARRIALG